ncbi:hypothetical protein, partial [Lactobacillus crispatus]|uniref:hypothetical protein n=1 Tax=Lactobacillus crispatus TaxID=47770 RepID=UPI00197BEA87
MQRIVSINAGEKLTFTIKRDGAPVTLQATPELREIKDNFNNVQRIGILGITRATTPGEVVTERVNPVTAVWLGVQSTWFVVDRTFAYIGGVFT